MNEDIQLAAKSLLELAEAIKASSSDKRSFLETHGWNFPCLNADELALSIASISEKISAISEKDISDCNNSDDFSQFIKSIPQKTKLIISN